ncbi:hypothetical protein K431DRAFT_289045 [Polychaeton citri CBS 116435]|uniref:WW domain-containing protein n=1 Tax=Polychaeton citri CBS 116435 TaxID=1314669 RepID=A0A9P4PXR7_9PEZI|nr:hypothetical protein K431DRAFT_289045 [Polychaeton citri CBS 116435]
MPQDHLPSEAPPSYDQAVGSSSSQPQRSSGRPSSASVGAPHLDIPGKAKNGIPVETRRSMEDLNRPLPPGWVRTFDPKTEHQFFVDTTKEPPRSVWVHPYDDEEYLGSLSSEERERIEQESIGRRQTSKADLMAEHTDEDESPTTHTAAAGSSAHPELPPRPDGGRGKGKESLGRRFKDKVTGTTHEEREAERKRREELERQAYQQHMQVRNAMATAMRTGQPQKIGKDKDGRDVYIEPPTYQPAPGYYGRGYGYSPYGGYPGGPGMYTTPNARYIRPNGPYGRPYGSGFGGGYGLPLAIGGGLLGGALLGGALGGF